MRLSIKLHLEALTVLLLLLLGNKDTFAQDYLANIQFYNSENGLAGRYANCTFKDSRGLIWIGTQFGLNRFDGRDFLLFDEVFGLPFNQVMEIHEDSEGWLWLFRTCKEKQICSRDLAFIHSITHEVHTFEEHFGEQLNFKSDEIFSILSDHNLNIFISAKRQIVRWAEGKVQHNIDLSEWDNTPVLMYSLEDEKLVGWYHLKNEEGNPVINWMVMDYSGKILHSQIIPNPLHNKGFYPFNRVGKDSKGINRVQYGNPFRNPARYFILSETGELSEDTSVWTTMTDLQNLVYNPFRPLAWQLHSGNLSVFSKSEGLIYRFKDWFPKLDRNLMLREAWFDNNDITWLSGRQGVHRIQFRPNSFQRILYNHLSGPDAPRKRICRGVTPLQKGELMLRTSNALYVMQTSGSNNPKKIDEGEFLTPLTLTKGHKDDFWGIISGTLTRINKHKQHYKGRSKVLRTEIKFQHVVSQYYRNNRLWLGTNKGLHYYDFILDEVLELEDYGEFEELKNHNIHQIYEESEERLWLCTTNGLYLFSIKNGIQKHYWEGGTGENKIPGTYFYQILPAQREGWWLAAQEGLIYWNPSEKTSNKWTMEEGLVSNEILAIHEDDFGFLWLATNQGLIQFQINTGFSKVWLEEEGISSHDFEPHTYYCQPDGAVWFGTTNGFTFFHPKDFKDIDFNEKPYIPLNIINFEQFSIESKKLENKTQELIENQQIILNPGEQLFNLRVALADYINGKEAQYAYQIKGFQDFWLEGKESLIRISGLPYGRFMLEIRGKMANGQYSSQEIHLPIHVLKPFYLKTWFIVLIGLSLLGGIWLWLVWRTSQFKRQQAILQKMVNERTQTIEQQAEDLKSLEQLKSRFFANVSHELRTPLTLMLGPVQSLIKRKEKNGKEMKLLQFVHRNAQQLLKLTNEILDLSKLEDKKLQVVETTVNLLPYLTDQMAQFHSFAASDQLKFKWNYQADKSLKVLLDTNKFEKIVHNFLSNALKFTPPNGQVTLTLKSEKEHLHLHVKDSGKGIHPKDLPYIFDRFYQSKQPDAKTESGTGIGLSLCKELAELLGGRVWAESELGKGSVFHFMFPKKVIDSSWSASVKINSQEIENPEVPVLTDSEVVKSKSEPSLLQQKTFKPQEAIILIVEDNLDLREYLKFLLSDYHVLTAENGKQALDILSQSQKTIKEGLSASKIKEPMKESNPRPNLIISDLMMPVLDGFDFLEKIKSDDQWRHVPTIMLTAKVNARAKLKALRIGVDDYITKPFQEEELIIRIENLLSNYRERMELFPGGKDSQEDNIPVIAEVDVEWLKQVEAIFEKNIKDSSFSIEKTSRELHLSTRQFQRRLKKITGLSPKLYLQEMRLQKAKDYLIAGKYATIKETAHATGFQDVRYFSDLFQKHFAVVPSSILR